MEFVMASTTARPVSASIRPVSAVSHPHSKLNRFFDINAQTGSHLLVELVACNGNLFNER